MFLWKFVCKKARAYNIMMFDFTDCADNCLGRPLMFPITGSINWSRSSRRTPAICYMVNWRLLTAVWRYSHPTACSFLFMLRPVLRTIFKCASLVLCLVAAPAALQWTNWCLRSCCVPISTIFDEAAANWPDLDPLGPGWGGCVSMICWCGIGEEDDNKKMWEALRII